MQWNPAGAEPVRDFADMLLAVGIVKVLPRAKDFYGLGTAADELIQQAGMQPFFNKNISRNRSQHICL